jgi:tRNA 5-methylaminomethyl-2-thiouridine biosynthesis bifunctional protein
MNTAPIAPAKIVLRDGEPPQSAVYGDIYHPRSGALEQARHVFLEDGRLVARWRGRDRFVVLETGFGLGNNFLATRAAWRDDPGRCRQLHYVAVEQSPPTAAVLASVRRDRALVPLAAELAREWPPLTCNLHRLVFDGGAVELLLAFGPVEGWLPQLVVEVDAFFLDGFAPAKNPAMWDARLFKAMARLAAAGAPVATWSAARQVRDGLRSAGFEVERAPGSGEKRDIVRGRFAPRFQPRAPARHRATIEFPVRAADASRAKPDAIIVGAGLAGCALAHALAERGLRSVVLERGGSVAGEASGNPVGLFHGVVHAADGRHARFHRAAALAARAAVRLAIERDGVRGSVAGLLRLETRLDLAAMRALVEAQGLPPDYVEALDAEAASRLAGLAIARPAWHYPGAGWVDPGGLSRSWLAAARVEVRLRTPAASLRRAADGWQVCDAAGATIAAAPVVAICTGDGDPAFSGSPPWPVRRQRGQLSSVASADARGLAVPPLLPVTGAGYVLPPIDGQVWFGATSSWDDRQAALRPEDQRRNAERLAELLGLASVPEPGSLAGRAGFRWVSDDRLPIVGAVPADVAERAIAGVVAAASPRLDQPRFVARAPGLFVACALGSRGIASAALGGQLLAAAISGAPAPAEADLIDAIDPARFTSRRFRRGEAARQAAAAVRDQPPVGPIAGSAGA